jgi:hypothetical protein
MRLHLTHRSGNTQGSANRIVTTKPRRSRNSLNERSPSGEIRALIQSQYRALSVIAAQSMFSGFRKHGRAKYAK